MRYERHNLHGDGAKRCAVYDLPPGPRVKMWPDGREGEAREYWPAVTDVACPCCDGGTIRWAEAGYVPGYRICDRCGRHFLAGGTAGQPTLIRVTGCHQRVRRAK